MTTTQNPEAIANSLLASKSDDELFDMLTEAERDLQKRGLRLSVWRQSHRTLNMVRRTLETRHGVAADMEAWMNTRDARTYNEALIDIIRAR
jgi:predicted Rossmann-fold nucleotide-binding protein